MTDGVEETENYMMSMTTIHANMIKTLFETLKDIITDVSIYFDKNGMKITAMNSAQVSLVYLELSADKINEGGFYDYNYHLPYFFIGVKISTLFKIIKTISKGDKFSWFIHNSSPEILHIQLDDETGSITTVYDYKLRDADEEIIEFPQLEYDYIFRIKASDFAKRIKDMSNIDMGGGGGGIMELEVIENQMAISCSGMWVEQRTHIIGVNSSETTLISNSNSTKSSSKSSSSSSKENKKYQKNDTYSSKKTPMKIEFLKSAEDKQQGKYKLKYLNIFTKASDLCEKNKIYFSDQKPIVIEYPVPNLGMLKFMLACETEETI